MTAALNIACRTIQRRLDSGESWDEIMLDYPRLTDEQKDEIRKELKVK